MINNKELAEQILNTVDLLRESVQTLYSYAEQAQFSLFMQVSADFSMLLGQLDKAITNLIQEDTIFEEIRKGLIINIADSLKRILLFVKTRDDRIFLKTEFELLPLIEELYLNLYFALRIKGELKSQKKFDQNLGRVLGKNHYIEEYHANNSYKYEVSIVVIAYNKLEYTRQCVEAILEKTPTDLNYELILINHGSSDGTKEYFESIGCTKQVDLKQNGIGLPVLRRIVEGKYTCCISNDVIVGENYLQNMLKCIESDMEIMWVVPTTTNISNFQTIPCNFSNLEEMQAFAKRNNVSDPYRWEQRVRLCNPLELFRSADMFLEDGPGKAPISLRGIGFGDDIASLLVRRAGGKCMLAKDAFCYHFGSVTLNEEPTYLTPEHIFEKRKEIMLYYNVDPWDTGFCFSPELITELPCENQENTYILGVGCGFGANPLKIKESIKENAHNVDVKIHNIVLEKRYLQDIKMTSDTVLVAEEQRDILLGIKNKHYDYIILEEYPRFNKMDEFIKNLKKSLKEGGYLCVFSKKESRETGMDCSTVDCKSGDKWLILRG